MDQAMLEKISAAFSAKWNLSCHLHFLTDTFYPSKLAIPPLSAQYPQWDFSRLSAHKSQC
jgi:hypothetical protein